MSQTETLDYVINLQLTNNCYTEIRKLEISLIRILNIVSRLSGNENLNAFIQKIQQTINMLRLWMATIRAVELASGPIGWLYAGTMIAGTALLAGDYMMEMGSG